MLRYIFRFFYRNRKVNVLERNTGFTEGLGRRLPSPDGSDHDVSSYFAEGGSDPVMESGEEPVDFYRLERTGKYFSFFCGRITDLQMRLCLCHRMSVSFVYSFLFLVAFISLSLLYYCDMDASYCQE